LIAGAHRARPAGLPAEPDSQLTRTTPGSASFGGATLARCSRKPPRVEAVWRDTPGGRHSGSFWRPATPRPCSDGARPRLVSGAFRTVPGPDAPVGGGSLVAAVPAVIRAEAGREAPGAQLPERCSVALVSGVHLFLPGLVWPDRATSSHRLTVGSGTNLARLGLVTRKPAPPRETESAASRPGRHDRSLASSRATGMAASLVGPPRGLPGQGKGADDRRGLRFGVPGHPT
jgi:hypothetical protein